MKNHLILLTFLFCFLSGEILLAQCGTPEKTDEEMETLPWYGNNQYLYDFMNDKKPHKI